MTTRYQGNRWGGISRIVASLFIAVSLIVSGCSKAPLQTIVAPNQSVPNTTMNQPPPAPAAVPNTTPNTTPVTTTTTTIPVVTPPPLPTPTPNTTSPPPLPPVPAPNMTQNNTPSPAPTPTPNATPNETQALVSYAKVQLRFNMFCATSSCHDGTGNTTLNLMPGVSYKMLVNVPSDFLKGKIRVKPGAPEQSVIIIMINDPEHATVPQSVIDTIKQWILEGALNN
jgi:hypothetical protein